MDRSLLQTKLYIPAPQPTRLQRPRLLARLSASRQHATLTLVSAPAGFGKTTLVAEWCRHLDGPVAWVSLDDSDNDPVRFWRYLIAALQTVDVSIGERTLALLAAPEPPPLDLVVSEVVNDLIGRPEPIVLVLDDYHVITTEAIHTSLNLLCDHIPPTLHLVITTRADPPLHLARRRGRAELVELRARALRFTAEEAADFLNVVMGLGLSSDDIAALEARTEGWAVGLQMAALSLHGRGRADTQTFITNFAGDDRYIADYLAEEVLQRQPSHVQSFLLHTAVLDRLSGPLCDAVVERADSQALLEELEQANLFIVPLDNRREWYRYHHLFADLLRTYLRRTEPERMPALHRRAAAWYEEHDLTAEAIHHALAAGDYAHGVRLIDTLFWLMLQRGEQATLKRWLASFPEDVRRSHPELSLWYAWVLLFTGDIEDYEPHVRAAESQWRTAGNQQKLGRVLAFRANVARLRGDTWAAITVAQDALTGLPEDDDLYRSIALMVLGSGYVQAGNVTDAERVLGEARVRGDTTDNLILTLIVMNRLADVRVMQAQLHEAVAIYEDVLQQAGDRPLWQVVEAHIGLADVHREWNDLDTAEDHLRRAVELAEQTHRDVYFAAGHLARARVYAARGDIASARASAMAARDVAQRFDHPDSVRRIEAYMIRLHLLTGELDAVQRWLTQHDYLREEAGTYRHEAECLTLARCLLATHRSDEARALLDTLLQAAEAAQRIGSQLEILGIQALVNAAGGDTASALRLLGRALLLAAPAGYVRLFVDEGPPMAALLRCAAASGTLPAYVNRVLDCFAEPAAAIPVKQPLIEPLTERELEVLRLIADGATNREIADRLVIALTTAKKHVSNILGKLNVSNRTEAVARARELQLL